VITPLRFMKVVGFCCQVPTEPRSGC